MERVGERHAPGGSGRAPVFHLLVRVSGRNNSFGRSFREVTSPHRLVSSTVSSIKRTCNWIIYHHVIYLIADIITVVHYIGSIQSELMHLKVTSVKCYWISKACKSKRCLILIDTATNSHLLLVKVLGSLLVKN